MKKKILYFLPLLLILFIMSSCDKEEDSTKLVVNLSRTITVKGYVYAELNEKTAGLEYAPAGTLLYCSIPYSDLNSVASMGKWADTAVVDENGQFSITVPVDDNGVNLTIEAIPFEYNQVQPFGSSSTTIKEVYSAAPVTRNVSTTSNSIIEVFYISTPLANYVEKVKVNITVEAELNESLTGNEVVANQKITLFNSGWAQEYTTGDDGKFTATVPANENINYTISFVYGKTVSDGLGGYTTEQYEYKANSVLLGNFNGEVDQTIDLGGGVKVP
jgi:hypothetical protein